MLLAVMTSRARNKLTVKGVEALTKPGVYSDGGGLYLRVRPSARSWFFIYTVSGRRREMGLGSDLDVTLAQARNKAAAARLLILEGRDPITERSSARVPDAPPITFGEFAIQHIDDIEGGSKNPKHRQQWRNTITTYAGSIFAVPLSKVSTENVLSVLQPIWLTKPETAGRVRGRIEKVLDAAKAKGLRTGENPARSRGHLDLLLPKRSKINVKHHAALPFKDVATFLCALRSRPGTAARALEFTILTAARSGEVRGMTWGEVDIDAMEWKVPAERMKAGRSHVIPLSETAQAILLAAKPESVGAADLVFPAPRGRAMSDATMAAVLKRMGCADITVHGFRSTFRNWAGDATEFAREVIELALAHTVGNKTERSYYRNDAFEKRRLLMAAWAVYCRKEKMGDLEEPPNTVSDEV